MYSERTERKIASLLKHLTVVKDSLETRITSLNHMCKDLIDLRKYTELSCEVNKLTCFNFHLMANELNISTVAGMHSDEFKSKDKIDDVLNEIFCLTEIASDSLWKTIGARYLSLEIITSLTETKSVFDEANSSSDNRCDKSGNNSSGDNSNNSGSNEDTTRTEVTDESEDDDSEISLEEVD